MNHMKNCVFGKGFLVKILLILALFMGVIPDGAALDYASASVAQLRAWRASYQQQVTSYKSTAKKFSNLADSTSSLSKKQTYFLKAIQYTTKAQSAEKVVTEIDAELARRQNPTQTYTVSASSSSATMGSVSGGGKYSSGATCVLTATAKSGYQFVSWTKNGSVVSNSATYSFTVTATAAYIAKFEKIKSTVYTISARSSSTIMGTVSGGGKYSSGATCVLTATVKSGYEFVSWTKSGSTVSSSATYSFTVTSSATYVANFKKKATQTTYTVTVRSANSIMGSVSGGGKFTSGTICRLSATAKSGYEFVSWTKNGTIVSSSANYAFMVDSSVTFIANFQKKAVNTTYTVTARSANATMGTVTGGGKFQNGSTCTLKATAKTGYEFLNWTKNGLDVSSSATYTFTVNATATYVANFKKKERITTNYTISASSSSTIMGTVTGGGKFSSGATCTLKATAKSGYEFVSWLKSNVTVSSNATYSFTVSANASYVAKFQKKTVNYTISVSSPSTTMGTVFGGGSYAKGRSCTVSASSRSPYIFMGWFEGTTKASSSASYTFTVSGNRSLTASFLAGIQPTASDGTYASYVEVSWASMAGVSKYEIYRGITSTYSSASYLTTASSTTYKDSSVTAGTTYYYWIRPVTPDGNNCAYDSTLYDSGYAQKSVTHSFEIQGTTSVKVGNSCKLQFLYDGQYVLPASLTSSNASVATVKKYTYASAFSGEYTGVKAGTATITATYKGVTAKMAVTVTGGSDSSDDSSPSSGYISGDSKLYHTKTYYFKLYVGGKNVTYSAKWGKVGTAITSYGNGRYLAGNPAVNGSSVRITATYGGKSYSKTVKLYKK